MSEAFSPHERRRRPAIARALLCCVAACVADCNAARAMALDWRDPETEPHDAAAAAERSDEYAWRLFIALNWPADLDRRGPDRSARFGADRPVVWESWMNAGEVFLDGGADPGPWLPRRASQQATERRFEVPSRQQLHNLRHVVAGVMVPLEDPLAAARRLTEIHLNRTSYEFVRAHELYNIEGQLRAYAAGGVSFPLGAKQVKAKWRPIGEAERGRYHTMEVTLADGTRRLFGLTGLHIASKDLQHWFWTTFEHVDNPNLADNEGWQLASRDRFACAGEPADCNRAPSNIGLEGTVWRYYRLRGVLTQYTDARGEPQRLANSELESGMQASASCITCHSRATLGVVNGAPVHLAIFDNRGKDDPWQRRGFIGNPSAAWFEPKGDDASRYVPLDFVWSLVKAQSKSALEPEVARQ
jgi:hypothetical protein